MEAAPSATVTPGNPRRLAGAANSGARPLVYSSCWGPCSSGAREHRVPD